MPRHVLAISIALLACTSAALAGALTSVSLAPAGRFDPGLKAQSYDRDLAQAYVDSQCWQCHTISTLSVELARDFGAQASGARAAGPDLAGIGGLYSDGWHAAHLWQPQDAQAGSKMPSQRSLFVLNGLALTDNGRGEKRPALKLKTQQAIAFLQSLDLPSVGRLPWPRGHRNLPESGNVKQGRDLFVQHCTGCHGERANGSSPAARFFAKPPANLAGGVMQWRTTAAPLPSYDDLFTTITNGLPGSGMPSFSAALTDRDRASLVAYIASLNRDLFDAYEPEFEKEVAGLLPALTSDLIARGKTLFGDKNFYKCADCHGADGAGGGHLQSDVISKYGFPPRDLVSERLRRGDWAGVYATLALGLQPQMVGYLKSDRSNEADLWALAAFVRSINRFEFMSRAQD